MVTTDRKLQPLTPEEWKAEVNRKGWTYRAVADRWGVTENYVSKTARNINRAIHWDDAVRGLPTVLVRAK